ncbi:MAG: small multi-drug export protein, partial [Clostridia bacterium]|nr:small multi-drug export protein [Clostridia bacterium]
IRKLKTTKFFHKLAIFAEDILADKAEKVKKSSEKGIAKRASSDNKKFYGLLTFVSIPLPLTGSWMGSAIGAALDFKLWKAGLAIFIGNIIAAAILTVLMIIIPLKYIDIILYTFLAIAMFSLLFTFFVALIKHKKHNNKKNCSVAFNADNKEEKSISTGNTAIGTFDSTKIVESKTASNSKNKS